MKDTEKIRAQMHEILDTVLDGNGFEMRSRDDTGTLPTLFLNIHGHVEHGNVSIRLYEDGWRSGGHYTEFEFTTVNVNSRESINTFREAVQNALADKKESEILARDIEAQVERIADEKDKLKNLKKSLRKAEKKEKAAVGAAT